MRRRFRHFLYDCTLYAENGYNNIASIWNALFHPQTRCPICDCRIFLASEGLASKHEDWCGSKDNSKNNHHFKKENSAKCH